MRPRLPPRVETARIIVLAEAPVLFLLAVYAVTLRPVSVPAVALAVVGAGVLVWGAFRIGRDRPATPRLEPPGRAVPWDWTDFLIFWPGAYTVAQVLVSIAVSVAHGVTSGLDPAVRTAVEAFVAQAAYYTGALFNLWVLLHLRRGATLADLGWRRFRWWWLIVAVVGAAATLELAGFLQVLMEQLFPSLPNTQCTAVRHDYSHFLALAIVVVCVVAPVAEETIFRGFVYGWLHRVSPALIAVPASALLFALVHGVVLLLLPLFAVGCVLALFYQGSRSIWPGVVVHALFNLPGIISILNASTC